MKNGPGRLAVLHLIDNRRAWRGERRQHFATQKGVDERALPALELADDHDLEAVRCYAAQEPADSVNLALHVQLLERRGRPLQEGAELPPLRLEYLVVGLLGTH